MTERCDGTGPIRLGVSDEIVTCVCGGLGWIPLLEDPVEERRADQGEGERDDTPHRA